VKRHLQDGDGHESFVNSAQRGATASYVYPAIGEQLFRTNLSDTGQNTYGLNSNLTLGQG